jgi:hypothetical protein
MEIIRLIGQARDSEKKGLIPLLKTINQDYVRQGTPISVTVCIPGIGEVTCSSVFRAIQGKRLVCLGKALDRTVIVKLYFSPRRARANWKRSNRGCRAFSDRYIPSPDILFSGYVPEYGLYAMVFEYLTDALRIDSALDACTDVPRQGKILDLLVGCLASLHERGIEQNDLHMGNFMISGERVYALDGDQVSIHRGPIERNKSFGNLARLLANLPTTFNTIIDERIKAYGNRRGWDISDGEVKKIKKEVWKIRWNYLSEYLAKINRTQDPFISRSDACSFSVFDRHHVDVEFDTILSISNNTSNEPGYSLVRIGPKDMLVWSSCGYGPFVMKRFWPAGKVWRNGLMLRRLNIQAPHPIALVIRKRGFLRWDCSVFFKPVEGMNLKDLLLSRSISADDKKSVTAGLADALFIMNGMGITLKRIVPEEILVSENKPVFLGLDAVSVSGYSGLQEQSKALNAFISLWNNQSEIKGIFIEQFRKRDCI